MPEAATVAEPLQPLEPFEGRDVIGAKIQITKAGDGLSEALSVDPQAFPLGSKRFVVLECEVVKVRMAEVKDTDALVREHTFEAQGATIVDATLVADLVQAQKDIIRRAKEKAAGIEPLPFDDTPEPDTSALAALSKDQLQALCDSNAVPYTKKAPKSDLVALLAEVPGIMDVAASFAVVPDSGSEATVTSLDERK